MAKFCLRTVPIVADSAVFEVCGFLPNSFKFALVNLRFARLYPSAEMWPSGRRRSPAKGADTLGKPLKFSGFFVSLIADSQILPIMV